VAGVGPGGMGSGKTPIAGAVSRKGNVVALQFRYNNRENADIFGAAIRGC
jgi:hypothetical protein